jgi:5-methylcytosine-specific restriction endonuclease McrA
MRGIKVQKSHVKSSILDKTGGVCAVCGRALVHSKVTIDHYIPKYHGGTDDMRNLLPLCKNCNKRKGSRIVHAKEHYPFLKAAYSCEADEYKSEWETVSPFVMSDPHSRNNSFSI